MRAHLRSNAIAYLALFVSLGGTSYAAVTITSKQVRDRTLEGRDVKRNSLTGTEIREGTLSEVPRSGLARRADIATQADQAARATSADQATRATSADQATRATSADQASRAGTADTLAGLGPASFLAAAGKSADADKLDGVDSAQFLRTSVVTGVTADTSIALNTVYTDPLLGFILRTDNDTSIEADLDVVNVQPAGGRTLRVMRSASSPLLPPGFNTLATMITADNPTLVIDEADPTSMVQITCAREFPAGPRVVCMVVRSRN